MTTKVLGLWWLNKSGSALPSKTDCVIRSCSNVANLVLISSVNAASVTKPYIMPRSIRLIDINPQRWAISVALLDHGEIVPERGTTNIESCASLALTCTSP